jgi:hypothetical protein
MQRVHLVGDAPMLTDLLSQIPPDQEIASVTTDGAFYTRKYHDATAERGAAPGHPAPQERQILKRGHCRSDCAQ